MIDLVISDIHADILALNTIIEFISNTDFQKKYGKISRIINLGDVLERGTHPKQVLEKMLILAKKYQMISVMGNHDEAFLYGRMVSGRTLESEKAHNALTRKELSFFKKNQDGTFGQQEFLDKENNLFCVHGGPLDPKKITPKNTGEDAWLYQKTWQRLSEDEGFFSYSGYHYSAESAFTEAQIRIKNPIILCGHQHIEHAIKQNKKGITEILSTINTQTEKISGHIVERKEIPIDSKSKYLIRIGLGGPEGYKEIDSPITRFGIIQHDSKKIILFGIKLN